MFRAGSCEASGNVENEASQACAAQRSEILTTIVLQTCLPSSGPFYFIMANVLQSPIDFHPRPVNHAPSPFGFGFGLGTASSAMVTAGWQSTVTPGHTNPLAFQQLASSFNQLSPSRAQKRRHEPEGDAEIDRHVGVRDDAMDRSPTPERPKRSAPKRARMSTLVEAGSKDEKTTKENKAPGGGGDDNEVDVGVLLGTPMSIVSVFLPSFMVNIYSELATSISITPPDFPADYTTFTEIHDSPANPSSDSRNCHSSTCIIRQEAP
jgi:hypothetical protein